MALKLNIAQIVAAARGNNDLRETLTGIYNELQALYAQTGSGPIQKIDAAKPRFTGAPPASSFVVTGANGQFTVAITLPQQAAGAAAPANATSAPIYQELSSSPQADFASSVTIYPLSTSTHLVIPAPGQTLYWRLRSSYDQRTFNSYLKQADAVAAGLQSSIAIEKNLSLNQSNFATVDSVADGSSASVRIYGPGGVGTAWTRINGTSSQVIPSGTITNVPYGSNYYVAWDGAQYRLAPSLTQTFPDHWTPVGKVSVIANGSGVVLPTFKAVVSSGAIVAIQIVTAGNDLTSAPTLTITDSTGTGATATCTVSAGSLTGVTVTNAGSGYSSAPAVAASGGVNGGATGGGGATGTNGGRLYADV